MAHLPGVPGVGQRVLSLGTSIDLGDVTTAAAASCGAGAAVAAGVSGQKASDRGDGNSAPRAGSEATRRGGRRMNVWDTVWKAVLKNAV